MKNLVLVLALILAALAFLKYQNIAREFQVFKESVVADSQEIVATEKAKATGKAAETEPSVTGFMQGFPPAKEKTLSAADGSFFTFPALRYSVSRMREFFPTRAVRASNRVYPFKKNVLPEIDSLKYTPWGDSIAITFEESLSKNFTDGIVILYDGEIVYEKYFGDLDVEGVHAAMSVSKSFAGTMAAFLGATGELDPKKLVTDYIPELENSGYAGATVQQIMDMTASIAYSEDYTNPNAEVWAYSLAGNPFRPTNYAGPKNYYEYLPTLKKIDSLNHGDVFGYKTVNTEVLGWIISRATNKGLAELVSERIWKPLGASTDAYYNVDPSGIAMAGGGLSLNLRDMAAFGEMIRNRGFFNGKQILPEKAVNDIMAGGDVKMAQNVFEKSGEYPLLKGWSYRDMWWRTGNANGAFMARGVHGQAIYIDPKAKMVIARFASHQQASNKYLDPMSIPAYEAVAEFLINKLRVSK